MVQDPTKSHEMFVEQLLGRFTLNSGEKMSTPVIVIIRGSIS